jgi:CBS domain-containing protein
MDDIFVARLMSTDLRTVRPGALVEEAAALMRENEIGSVVVVDEDNELQGILTSTDFINIVAERKPKDRTPVSTYMSTDVVTTTAQEPIQDAADRMIEHGFHHLPVVDDSEGVIGMISTTDLTAYISRLRSPTPA